MGKPGLDNGGDDGAAAAARQDPAVQKALTYQPSPEVERRTHQELFDSIVVRIADPATKEKVEQTVTSDALWLQFHQVLTKAGYSTTNLADVTTARSEEHTSELQSLMRISYAVFCLKKQKKRQTQSNKEK